MTYVVVQLEQKGYACPSQWDGMTREGDSFYARYRSGRFYATVCKHKIYETYNAEELGYASGDVMTTENMKKILKGRVNFK